MTCPECQTPLLFGATECSCGWSKSAEPSSMDLTHMEAIAAYWRIYWPFQLASLVLGILYALMVNMIVGVVPQLLPLWSSSFFQFVFIQLISLCALYMVIGRLVGRSYRTFSLKLLGADGQELPIVETRRRQLLWFVWWRTLVAGLAAGILMMPFNILVTAIWPVQQLQALPVNPLQIVSIAVVVLIAGPIIMRLLIGHQFPDFRIEVTRRSAEAPAPQPTVPDTN